LLGAHSPSEHAGLSRAARVARSATPAQRWHLLRGRQMARLVCYCVSTRHVPWLPRWTCAAVSRRPPPPRGGAENRSRSPMVPG
jgi:hypothetical protein